MLVHLDFPGKQGSGGAAFCWDLRTSQISLCLDPVRSLIIDTCFGKGPGPEKPYKPSILSVEYRRIQENYNDREGKRVSLITIFFMLSIFEGF